MGKKKEKQRRRELAECVYIAFYRSNHRRITAVSIPVGTSDDKRATSLYGDPDLNLSVIPSIKSYEKIQRHHNVSSFQNSTQFVDNSVGIYRWNNSVGIYRPSCRRYVVCRYISPTAKFCRCRSTKLEMELYPSVKITDKIILSVIPLVFANFLVVIV